MDLRFEYLLNHVSLVIEGMGLIRKGSIWCKGNTSTSGCIQADTSYNARSNAWCFARIAGSKGWKFRVPTNISLDNRLC